MRDVELDGEIEAVTAEIQKIQTQFSASKKRIAEMALTPGYKKTREYMEECDWRHRASFANQKLLDELRDLKGQRREGNIVEDGSRNEFINRVKNAAIMALLAHDRGDLEEVDASMDLLRLALGRSVVKTDEKKQEKNSAENKQGRQGAT